VINVKQAFENVSDIETMLHRLEMMMGLKFAPQALQDLQDNPSSFKFLHTDLVKGTSFTLLAITSCVLMLLVFSFCHCKTFELDQ